MKLTGRMGLVPGLLLLLAVLMAGIVTGAWADSYYRKGNDWPATMIATREALAAATLTPEATQAQWYAIRDQLERDFPVHWDWMLQDSRAAFEPWFVPDGIREMILRTASRLERELEVCAVDRETLHTASERELLDAYIALCEARRASRLAGMSAKSPRFIFAKHFNMGSSHYAYTEALSDSQYPGDYQFVPGSALCLLEMDGLYATVRTLHAVDGGVIRNPDVSWDGKRILFAWKKSLREDDYHLYEMDVASGDIQQLSFGTGYADYEGVYLPNGDILFNSTRCVQTVDCWWTEVSNLYTCDAEGRYMRRLSFDQVHTNYPTVMQDGRILYTRWDYNDRGQLFPQGLFQMFPDGTAQAEFYGNNSWFPTTLIHARDIPNSPMIVAIATGHHTYQAGQLVLVNPGMGRQENEGVQLIAPIRNTHAVRIDQYGQRGALFQYPWPISGSEFVLSYHPLGYEGQAEGQVNVHGHVSGVDRARTPRFGIYWMDLDGNRELLASDPETSCNQPVPLKARTPPRMRPSVVDYAKDSGTYYIQDVYAGPGLEGIARGVVKRLRVIALEYRAAGIGQTRSDGPAGSALISTPIAIDNGSWDVKRILGDAEVHDDGSAYFVVPARTPLYFQAIDEEGQAVQTMRSWSTLQPGEAASCVGCHEHKNSTPVIVSGAYPAALRKPPQALSTFYGPPRGFSFQRKIQPILDKHCIGCHDNREIARGDPATGPDKKHAFSLLGETNHDERAKRMWSDAYLNLTRGGPHELVNWLNSQSEPPLLPPYHAGAARSRLMTMLREGHNDVVLDREELEKIAAWIDLLVPFCGDYTEANAWSRIEMRKYQHFQQKRVEMEEYDRRNIQALLQARPSE